MNVPVTEPCHVVVILPDTYDLSVIGMYIEYNKINTDLSEHISKGFSRYIEG